MVAYCSCCKDKKQFTALVSHEYKGAKDESELEYTFAVCDSCSKPSLFSREDIVGIGFEYWDYDRIYPKDERIVTFKLPELVRQSYDEAVKCENAKAFIAAVVMVGRALEAVCKDFFPQTKTIAEGLRIMKEEGLISDELLEWSNELRFLRNLGAHASDKKLNGKDAEETLDFLQAILEILYHLRPKFKEMKARREKPKA